MRPNFIPNNLTVGANQEGPGFYVPLDLPVWIFIAALFGLFFFLIKAGLQKRAVGAHKSTKAPAKIAVDKIDLETLVLESCGMGAAGGRDQEILMQMRRVSMPGRTTGPPQVAPPPPVIIILLRAIDTPAMRHKLGKNKEFRQLWTDAGFVPNTSEYVARALGYKYGSGEWFKKIAEIRKEGKLTGEQKEAVTKYEEAREEKKSAGKN